MLFGSKPPVICALAVGHCRSAPGARNPTSRLTEWEFNATLASRIGDCCPDTVTLVHRDDRRDRVLANRSRRSRSQSTCQRPSGWRQAVA
jgi:hypothetical protein